MKVSKERKVCVGSKYKHFKGHLVRVLCIANHTETGEDLVIYRNEENNKIYARPFSMFISEVDKENIRILLRNIDSKKYNILCQHRA